MTRTGYKQELVGRYSDAHREIHGTLPHISESKGYIWLNGKGGYLLEEIEQMTTVLEQQINESHPVAP